MPKKPVPTFEEHKEFGRKITLAADNLRNVYCKLPGHYRLDSKEVKVLARMLYEIDDLKSKLDSRVFEESTGRNTEELAFCYYPLRDEEGDEVK